MSATPPTHQSDSRDAALNAITEAQRSIGRAHQQLPPIDSSEPQRAKHLPKMQPRHSAKLHKGLSRFRLVLGSLIGLLGLAGICFVVFAWQMSHGQVASEPVSTSSISIKKNEDLQAQPAPGNADAAGRTDTRPPLQTKVERVAAETTPVAAPMATDLAPQIQMIVREFANLQQGIEQLKAGQSQMARDNSELAERLKASQDIARHNADLSEELKAAQAQMTHDNGYFADQLKASQEQLASIARQLKESQEQVGRLLASEQRQRPKTLVSSSPIPIANPARRTPTSPPPPLRVQTPDPGRLSPKPQ